MTEIKITNEEKIHISVQPVTPGGHPAPIDGVPMYEVQAGDATVVVDTDGMGAYLVSGDSAMESKIMIKVDADLGEGVQTISQEISLVVSLPTAATLGLVVGTPELK